MPIKTPPRLPASRSAANRLSYFLDWQGPSWAVDTACSSSLVAVHQACQSLLHWECNLALAGGVNLMLSPQLTLTFSEAQMMAADGRCKTFDAGADGYVRSEGCGVVVLKRLADALADGDNIQAVIRGSAVNQDGQTNGLTAPNGKSQQEVIRLALAKARVKPNQISYVETHGTGTSLGDPIEVNSLKAVLMEGRESNQSCWIGSVKTNIGHTEAAAGVAGLIKLVLSLKHGEIPPHLHLKHLNPYIELEKTPIEIPTQLQPWSSVDQTRLAGVSAFGFGGTNAHVILEEAPLPLKSQKSKVKIFDSGERPSHLLTLSAKCKKALRELAQRYHEFLGNNSTAALADICFTANTGRTHFNHRLAIIASDQQELAAKLAKISAGEEPLGVFSGKLPSNNKSPLIACLFTGQGSQYIDMGRQLYETQPLFRETLEQCDRLLQPYIEKSILEIIYPEDSQQLNNSLINQTAYTQPALFAIEYALFQLWQSWGIQPDVVMGHSVGEYVAATVAGVFSLEDGLKLIAHRGRLMQQLPSGGEMVAVMASEEKVNQLIAPYRKKVALAAINGPKSAVISGATAAIGTVRDSLESQGIKTKQLQVSHAFHSPLIEPMLAEFEAVAHQITYHQPTTPLISNVTGARADESIATASYWVHHVRQPVKFAQSMETLHQEGYEVFLEIGPKPILLGMARHCLPEEVGLWLPSLRPGQSDWQQMLHSLAKLYVRGVKVDWLGFERDYFRSKVVLPTYPFQRQRYWIENSKNVSQKACSLSPPHGSNPIFSLLNHEDIQQLTQQLEKEGDFSPEQVKLLPELLEVLLKKHQQQLTKVCNAQTNGVFKLNENTFNLNAVRQQASRSLKRDELLAAEPEERRQLFKSYLSKLLSKVTGLPVSELDYQQQLSSLGFDSLMATELRRQIEVNLEVMVPVEFFAQLSIDQFLTQVLLLIEKRSSTKPFQAADSSPSSQEVESQSIAATVTQENLWIARPQVNNQELFRLFCFPYAGAGASIFNSWSEFLSTKIQICPIQLPARESRLEDPPATRLKPLIQTLAPLLKPQLDIPFAFFGHSLGALLAFELTRELRRQNYPLPVHLFVSAKNAPQLLDLQPPIHLLPDSQFIEKIKRLNGTRDEVWQDTKLMQQFLPALRADFAILETYFYENEPPLDCPITAFGGLEDFQVSQAELAAWDKQTKAKFNLQMFPGDHFFLHSAQQELLQTLSTQLEQKFFILN